MSIYPDKKAGHNSLSRTVRLTKMGAYSLRIEQFDNFNGRRAVRSLDVENDHLLSLRDFLEEHFNEHLP